MKLLQKETVKVIQTTYTIQLEDGSVIHRIEFEDEKGKIIDSVTRSKGGEYLDTIDNAELIEIIDEFLDVL
jgi:hypothetical protein